jgi:hypothetical protein
MNNFNSCSTQSFNHLWASCLRYAHLYNTSPLPSHSAYRYENGCKIMLTPALICFYQHNQHTIIPNPSAQSCFCKSIPQSNHKVNTSSPSQITANFYAGNLSCTALEEEYCFWKLYIHQALTLFYLPSLNRKQLTISAQSQGLGEQTVIYQHSPL